ncbi:MAG TPA: DinB family protein [Arachidicoccus sp.]
MENTFKYILKNRELFLNLVDNLSIEQLNKIPEGFNNNIAWNFGHIVVSAQQLSYVRTGIKPDLDIQFKEKYQKNTKPDSFISQKEIDILKTLLLSTVHQIEEDVKSKVLANITPFSTDTYGYKMDTIDEVLSCIQSHDSLHYGYAMAQRKLVI